MYALRLEPDFINNLTPEGRRWLARAVVNMINIDGKLDPNEMPYMHDAVILIDESERAELLENAQQRNYMELPNLTTDRKYVGELLYYFASIVAADSKISTSEVEFLKDLEPNSVSLNRQFKMLWIGLQNIFNFRKYGWMPKRNWPISLPFTRQ